MDKIAAIILSILAVVVIVAVVIIGEVIPSIDNKSDAIMEQMDGLNYTGNGN